MDWQDEFEQDYRITQHTFRFWVRCRHCCQLFSYPCHSGPSERAKAVLREHAKKHQVADINKGED